MAIDREIELIQEANNQYEINTYTIKYDSKTKKFFKGFGPKVASGALLSASIFAGLGAVALTGGLAGVGIGAIAGASAGLGTAIQTVSSGIVYARNASQSRFKALGIGGEKDLNGGKTGTIGLVEKYEERVNEYSGQLASKPHTDPIQLDDGAYYSRRDLKKRIKEKEDIIYNALKYLLKQGLHLSDNINALRKKEYLTDYETEALAKYRRVMDRIAECVESVASSRLEFNPYKNLIIDGIKKGCLLGDTDYQNNQIRSVAASNDKELAIKLYSNIYEKPLLDKLRKERKNLREQAALINEENKKVVKVRKELIEEDNNISKIKAENRELAKKIVQLNDYQVLLGIAGNIAKVLPEELNIEKTTLNSLIAEFKKSIEQENAEEITAHKDALDVMVKDVHIKLIKIYIGKGKKSLAERYKNLFNQYEQENMALKANLEMAEDEAEMAAQGWYEAEQRANKQTKKYEGAVKRGAKQRAERKYWKDRAEDAEATVSVLFDSNEELLEEKDYLQERSEDIENKFNEIEQQLSQQKQKSKRGGRKVSRIIAQMIADRRFSDERIEDLEAYNDKLIDDNAEVTEKLVKAKKTNKNLSKTNKKLTKTVAEKNFEIEMLEDAVELAQDVAYDTHTQKVRLQKTNDLAGTFLDGVMLANDELQAELADEKTKRTTAEKKTKSTEKELKKAKNTVKKQTQDIRDLERNVNKLEDDVNAFVVAQGENIQQIIGLQADNQRLETESKQNATLAENLAWDLRKTQKELASVQSERDSHKARADELEEKFDSARKELDQIKEKGLENATRKEIDDYFNYIKMQSGKLKNLILKKVDNLEQRVMLTKETSLSQHLDDVLGIVDTARKIDFDEKELEDLQETYDNLKLIYDAQDKWLVKLPKTTRNKITKVIDGIEVMLITEQKTSVKVDR